MARTTPRPPLPSSTSARAGRPSSRTSRPHVKTNPATKLNLGKILINRNGPCKTIHILNTGGSNLAITSVKITNDPTGSFKLCEDVPASPAQPLILAPGASKPVSVRCKPATAAFQRTGFLTITSNDPDQPTRSVKLICRLKNDP